MAIALEADFRTIKTGQTPEPPDRQPADRGRGEEFASSLERARSADADKDSREAELVAAAAPASTPLPFLPADSELAAAPDPSAPPAPIAPQEAAEALLKSEIVIDREIIREDVKAAPAAPAATAPDAMPAGLAVAAPQPDAPPAFGQPFAISAETSPTVLTPTAPAQTGRPEPTRADTLKRPPGVAAPEVATTGETVTTAAAAAIEIAQTAPPSDTNVPQVTEAAAAPAPANPDAAASAQAPIPATTVPDVSQTETVTASLTGAAEKLALSDAANSTSPAASAPSLVATTGAPVPSPAAPAAGPVILAAPAQAVLTASPAQIVDIVSQSAEDGQSDRVVVQLDPPELGRVSIDFKFDAQGLQHVTITSETPEAMRQLRQMHFELVQSLERHGIGSQNMSFQHQQQDTQQSRTPNPFARAGTLGDSGIDASAALASTQQIPGARTLPGGRLDIRL